MKIYKSSRLELTHRLISLNENSRGISFGLVFGFSLNKNLEARPTKDLLWKIAKRAMGEKAVFDEGLPKHQSEFLAFGSCFHTNGTAQPVSVSISVANVQKEVVVYGDRFFQPSGLISSPDDFNEIPISPEYAFGGPDFALNPKGKGIAASKSGEAIQLPNIETLNRLMTHVGDQVPISGFWAQPPDSPNRLNLLGKFDQHWFKTRWPDIPLDTHPDYYQVAPKDQRFHGYFSGNEFLRITNLHPDIREINSRLPGMRARLIYEDTQDSTHQLHEVATTCETLYLFPNDLFGLILYRGIIPLKGNLDASQLKVYADIEEMSSPVLEAKDIVNRIITGSFEDPAPSVENASSNRPKADASPNTDTQNNQSDSSKKKPVQDAGIEILNAKMKEIDKSVNDLANKLGISKDQFEKIAQEQHKKLQSEMPNMEQALGKIKKGMDDLFKKFNIDEKQLLTQMMSNPNTREAGEAIVKSGAGFAGVFKDIEGALSKFKSLDPVSTQGPKQSVPQDEAVVQQASVEPKSEPVKADVYDRLVIIELLANGKRDFSGLNLGKLDLSGLDLSGVNFSRCQMSESNLSQTILNTTKFDRAILKGVMFTGVMATKVSLKAVSAQATNWDNAVLEDCDFTDADCSKSSFSAAKFNSVFMNGTALFDCNFATAQLNNCSAIKSHFDGSNLSVAKLLSSHFGGTTFVAARCIGTEFVGADLTKTNFSAVSGNGAIFKNCNADESIADNSTTFSRATFSDSTLNRANWQGICAQGSTFSKIRMSGALFSQSAFNFCHFDAVDGRAASFNNVSFENADLITSNFMESNFKSVNFNNAKIIGCNLFGANLLQAKVRNLIVDRTNIDRTILAARQM